MIERDDWEGIIEHIPHHRLSQNCGRPVLRTPPAIITHTLWQEEGMGTSGGRPEVNDDVVRRQNGRS